MSENSVNPVGRIEIDLSGFAQLSQAVSSQPPAPAKSHGGEDVLAARVENQAKPSEAKPAEAKPEKASGQNPMVDISLKFQVDPQTNDVTILILNRASRQVVRTIPPEDMSKMGPGEILQLFA